MCFYLKGPGKLAKIQAKDSILTLHVPQSPSKRPPHTHILYILLGSSVYFNSPSLSAMVHDKNNWKVLRSQFKMLAYIQFACTLIFT